MLNDWRYGSVEDLIVTSFCWLALMPRVGLEDNTRSTEAVGTATRSFRILYIKANLWTWRLSARDSNWSHWSKSGDTGFLWIGGEDPSGCTPLNFLQLIRVLFGVWIPYYGCIFHSKFTTFSLHVCCLLSWSSAPTVHTYRHTVHVSAKSVGFICIIDP